MSTDQFKYHTEVVVCGRSIGRVVGSPSTPTEDFILKLHNFSPAPGYNGPIADDMVIDFINGRILTYQNEDEDPIESVDLFEAIKRCKEKLV